MSWNKFLNGCRQLNIRGSGSCSRSKVGTPTITLHHSHGRIMIVRQLSRLGGGGGGANRLLFVAQTQPGGSNLDFQSCVAKKIHSSGVQLFSNISPSESNAKNKGAQNNLTEDETSTAAVIKRGDPDVYFEMSKSFIRSETWKSKLISTMLVYPNFITEEEEESLMKEIEPYISRLHYETAHWDAAIHDYRETERSKWTKSNEKIINRIRGLAFPVGVPQLKLVHILDLAKMGVIKPHIDSIRFCGNTIAGLSLLSDSVMRLCHDVQKDFFCDVFLPRRSLYVMNDFSRYEFTHEILGESESTFKNQSISRDRRVSIICRNEPVSTPGPVFKPLISN